MIPSEGSRRPRVVLSGLSGLSGDNENYHHDSVGAARFFHGGWFLRGLSAFEDCRWDFIGQHEGPETSVVHNSRGVSNFVASCMNPVE